MFAEGAGWNRPIYFTGGVGGHCAALEVSRRAKQFRIKRQVIAHVGRPTIRAIDAGERLPFGEFGVEGRVYRLQTRETNSRV
jgi:hypothetical protein